MSCEPAMLNTLPSISTLLCTVRPATTSRFVGSKKITGWKLALVLGFCALILAVSLIPHLGIALLSFAKFWSFTLLPSEYTLEHYNEVFIQTPHYARNTIIYCSLAALIDVGLGALIAFLLVRGKIIGKSILDFIATFSNTRRPWFADRYLCFVGALEYLFQRAVSVVTERSLRSPRFRQAVEAVRQKVFDERDDAQSA